MELRDPRKVIGILKALSTGVVRTPEEEVLVDYFVVILFEFLDMVLVVLNIQNIISII